MQALKYENLARNLFQTGNGNDPLKILTEAAEWDDLLSNTLKSYKQEDKLWKSNDTLIFVLEWLNTITEELQLSEFPHISYEPTNIK